MSKKILLSLKITFDQKGQRLDVVVAKSFPQFSRNHLQKLIKDGHLKVDGKKAKPKDLLRGSEEIEINYLEEPSIEDKPEDINLDIIHEDEDIMVINKQAGLVAHPGAGNPSGTLVNGLINHDARLAYLPRAGLVHRLDKDTSGLMVISKNEKSYLDLVNQLKNRSVKKTYSAMVVGIPALSGFIDEPIGRHTKLRTKQAVTSKGKEAITRYKVLEKMNGYSHLEVTIKTGRTHQIRVHLAFLGFPIIGDLVYGSRKKYAKGTSDSKRSTLDNFKRQALHAKSLTFLHPNSKEEINFTSDLPEDLKSLRESLQAEQ